MLRHTSSLSITSELKRLESTRASAKRTSENIRQRALKYNPCLTRISTKQILKEHISRGLVETEMIGRKRYYWFGEKGRMLISNIMSRKIKDNGDSE